jgi:hypothetical protein
MVKIILHKDATDNMKEYYYGKIPTKPYGHFDVDSMISAITKRENLKLIAKYKTDRDTPESLEFQKLLFINQLEHYIAHSTDSAGEISAATTLRTNIIGDLDAGVDSYYTTISYKLLIPEGTLY